VLLIIHKTRTGRAHMPRDDPGWHVYCLVSTRPSRRGPRTYVGATNNLATRLRRHNGALSGGARATRSGRPWRFLYHTDAPMTKSEALSLERRIKNSSRRTEFRGLAAVDRRVSAAAAMGASITVLQAT
jgi:structure-specific endonuclease subunit SLX1